MHEYHGPKEEFNALRQEMEQTRQYVFERPLLIITASLAALALFDKPFVVWLIPLAVGLLTVNLWFTAERMRSHSRIAAYIQLVLEQKVHKPWLGWETYLCYFRKWMSAHRGKVRDIIKVRKSTQEIPRAAGYYPAMWLMHLGAALTLFGISVTLAVSVKELAELAAAVLTSTLLAVFLAVAVDDNPGKLADCIMETAQIWIQVFEELVKEENKTANDVEAKEDPCSLKVSDRGVQQQPT